MNRYGSILSNSPFLRLLVPLCLGVSLPSMKGLLNPYTVPLLFTILFLILFMLRKGNFYLQPLWGVLLFIALFLFGQERVKLHKMNFPVLPDREYFVVLDEYPEEKEKTFRMVGQFLNHEQKILIYLPKSMQVKNAEPGDIFSFVGFPELLKNDGNPFEFDYCKYLNSRSIGYRIFLKERQFCLLHDTKSPNIFRHALKFRRKLLDCLGHSGINSENVHLIGSISFGAREEVDKETIQSFTNTGVIHVLAVSGMNVGLVFVILDFLFRFLKSRPTGYYLHLLIMLTGIWSYTLVTGMSPSILRAAMMFSFVLFGTALRRSTGIFNSLAVSAFFLIAWNPDIFRDAGFQLSYAAVLSIVVIQPFIYKLFVFKRRLPDKIWLLVSVTLAAQIGTIPFTLQFFHQFPVYFLIANMIVIPLVTVILYLSFVVVFLSTISVSLATLVATVLSFSSNLVLLTVNSVERLPHSVIRGLYPNYFQMVIVLTMGYCLVYYLKTKKILLLQTALGLASVLVLSIGISSYVRLSRSEVVFFNIPGMRAMALTNGSNATVFYDRFARKEERLAYYMKPYFGERRIKNVEIHCLTDSLLIKRKNIFAYRDFICFMGVQIYIQPSRQKIPENATLFPSADVVWLRNNIGTYNAPPYIPKSKIILGESLSMSVLQSKYPGQKFLTVDQAVKITTENATQGNRVGLVCNYFSHAE